MPRERMAATTSHGQQHSAQQMASAIATAKIQEGPLSMITIGDTPISERLGKKEDLIKYVEQLEIERQENAEVYSKETLNRLENLIKEYHKLILSL